MPSRLGRRDFLRTTAWAAAGPLLVPGFSFSEETGLARPRVIHVHHGRAAMWTRLTGTYRDFVDQSVVNRMLDDGVRLLKGGSTTQAWQAVFNLTTNETRRLGIKINLNNSYDPANGAGNIIDAIPEPAIAVIRGFVAAGGLSSNVTIFDGTNTTPTRYMATWLKNRVRGYYPDVHFSAAGGSGKRAWDPRTYVTWSPAYTNTPPETRIYGTALDSDYLVNIPIVKRHGQANVTLGYKNHLGTISGADALHPWLFADCTEASVLADIMGSPVVSGDPSVRSIRQKTVLTVGDMLFGQPCSNWGVTPRPWKIFRNEWPNNLIISDDPVAADSVMLDILESEPAIDGGCGSIRSWSRRYLQFAQAKGQGVFGHVTLPSGQVFDPSRMNYNKIDYQFHDIWPSGADLRVTRESNGVIRLSWTHYFPGACAVWRATQPDFSDGELLGQSPVGQYADLNPPEPAFYRVYYAGS